MFIIGDNVIELMDQLDYDYTFSPISGSGEINRSIR